MDSQGGSAARDAPSTAARDVPSTAACFVALPDDANGSDPFPARRDTDADLSDGDDDASRASDRRFGLPSCFDEWFLLVFLSREGDRTSRLLLTRVSLDAAVFFFLRIITGRDSCFLASVAGCDSCFSASVTGRDSYFLHRSRGAARVFWHRSWGGARLVFF